MPNRHDSPSPSPPRTAAGRRMKTCARRCERACCLLATYFPLGFVYGVTTWAVWVDANIGFEANSPGEEVGYNQKIPSVVGIILYMLLNASYTTAVFKDPGSPLQSRSRRGRGRYSELPTSEPTHETDDIQTITVSSTGSMRYCKKCQVQKPDRAHHCSTCKRCVLKMDHHCPWLATCLGLHNYKAFILFLIYTSLFCWVSFFNSVTWVYKGIFDDQKYLEQFAPVNNIMLAVLSGIIGLVITGFTSWHLYLCVRGLTTIECLEKTRYLSSVRKAVEQNRQERASHSRDSSDGLANNLKKARDQILEFHANAVPGASRFEEGEERTSPTPSLDHNFRSFGDTMSRSHHHQSTPSDASSARHSSSSSDTPAQRALRGNYTLSYTEHERSRENARYESYIDEKETSSLPNAFDLGWRKNLAHLFGPNPWLWWLPVCNTTGDGWRWEVTPKWRVAQEEMARRREERRRNAATHPSHHQYQQQQHEYQPHLRGGDGSNIPSHTNHHYADSAMSMQTLQSQQQGANNGTSKMRRDFDATGEDGEVASFQVSDSEADDSDTDSGSDSVADFASHRQQAQEQRRSHVHHTQRHVSHGDNGTIPTSRMTREENEWGSRW